MTMGWITFFLSVILGYLFFLYLSHPHKKKHKVPRIKIGKRIEFLPNFRVHIGRKTYHFHHWLILTLAIAIPLIAYEQFPYPTMIRGVLIGGILQGLRYSDRFKFRYPRELEHFGEQIAKDLNELGEKMKNSPLKSPKVEHSEVKND